MSLTSLLVHDVTIQTAGSAVDRYGNTVKDWAAATSRSVKGWLSQQGRTEDLNNRDAQVQDWVLFVPAGTNVTGHDRVTWSGITFEVVGPPLPAWTPRGEHHLEVSMRAVTG